MTSSNGEERQEGPIGGYTAEELVAALQASVGPDNPRSDLKQRLDACEALQEYADDNEGIAQYFAAILPNILMEEVERLVGTGSAGELILVRGLSLDVQRTILSVLEDVTAPLMFEKVDAFDDPAVELAYPAVCALAFEFTRETTRSSTSLLAKLTKWRPDAVADHIASRFDFDRVCRALADHIQDAQPALMTTEDTNEAVRHATRLLAVLLVTHADELTEPEPVVEALDTAATSDLNRTQAYAAIASDALTAVHSSIADDLESVRSFAAFVDEARGTEGGHRMDTARAVGEGITIERLDTDEDSPVDTILESMRDRDGSVRDAMAVAVGEYRLLDANSLVDVHQKLRAHAANAELFSRFQRRVRTALGTIALATPESFPTGLQTYVERLDPSTSPPGLEVLRELGRVIQREAVGDDGLLETLERAVRSTDGDAKERAARGFAELLLEAPERIPKPARPLVDALDGLDGSFRAPLLCDLAIATIAIPDDATDPRPPLVDFWEDPDTSATERAWAKQALGELAIVDRSLANDVTEPFVEHVFHGSLLGIDHRTFNTRILGEIIGSNPQTAVTPVNVYVTAVTDVDDDNQQWYALGALRNSLRALPSLLDDAVASLVSLVESLDRPLRVPAAAALGETVTMAPRNLPAALEPLREACVDAQRSVRDRIAQALGEAVARDVATPAALRDTYREVIPSLTGPNRWLTTQAFGELLTAVPAVAPASCESLLQHARTVHRQHRLSVTAAIGEVATLAPEADADADPLAVLEAHAAGTTDITWRHRMRLLGEAVLAEAPDVPARANNIIDNIGLGELVGDSPTFESAGSIFPGSGDGLLGNMLILEEFTQTPGEWRRATLLRLLRATVTGSFDANVARHLRAHIYKESSNTPVEFHSELIEIGVLDAESFLETVLEVGSGQAIGDLDIIRERAADGLRRYLDSSDPGRREILDAVSCALKKQPETEHATRIRRQLRTFLADATDVPPSTRLMAIEALTAARTAATPSRLSSDSVR